MTHTFEADLHEIAQLPLVTKISKGLVNKELLVKAAYDKDYNLFDPFDPDDPTADPVLVLERGDEVYVYENALGATYTCFMTAGRFRYFARITVGVDVIITEEGITNV